MGGQEFQLKRRKMTNDRDSGTTYDMSDIDKISSVDTDGGQDWRNGGSSGENTPTIKIEMHSIAGLDNDDKDDGFPEKLQDTLQYKFIKSFVKGCQNEFDDLSHQTMESKLASTALSSTLMLLCLPCGPCKSAGKPLIKPAEAFCKHLDKTWQKNRQLWWRHQTDSFKPSTSEKFYRFFIQLGLEVFHVYEFQIRGLYRQLPHRHGQTKMESRSGSQALTIFAEVTARLVFHGFTDAEKAKLPAEDILCKSLTKIQRKVKHFERRFWHHKLYWDSNWDNSDSDSDSDSDSNSKLKSNPKPDSSCPIKIDMVDLLTLPYPAFSSALLKGSIVSKNAPENENPEILLLESSQADALFQEFSQSTSKSVLTLKIRRPFKYEWKKVIGMGDQFSCRELQTLVENTVMEKRRAGDFVEWRGSEQVEELYKKLCEDPLFLDDNQKLLNNITKIFQEYLDTKFAEKVQDIHRILKSERNDGLERRDFELNIERCSPRHQQIVFGYDTKRPSKIKGRMNFLERLDDYLLHNSESSGKISKTVIFGLGGVGKSTVVFKYLDIYHNRFAQILWIQADSFESAKTSFKQLAKVLNLEDKLKKTENNLPGCRSSLTEFFGSNSKLRKDEALKILVNAIYTKLSKNCTTEGGDTDRPKEILVIFDNAESLSGIKLFLPEFSQELPSHPVTFSCLVTSRNGSPADWPDSRLLHLDSPPKNEMVEFVRSSLEKPLTPNNDADSSKSLCPAQPLGVTDQPEDFEKLVDLFECLPLALYNVTGFIRRERSKDPGNTSLTISKFIKLYGENPEKVLDFVPKWTADLHSQGGQRPVSLYSVLKETLDKLRGREDQTAKNILNILTVLPAKEVPVNFVAQLSTDTTARWSNEHLSSWEISNFREKLNALSYYSFIEIAPDWKTLTVHPILQAVLRLEATRNFKRKNNEVVPLGNQISIVIENLIRHQILDEEKSQGKTSGPLNDNLEDAYCIKLIQHFYRWPSISKILGQEKFLQIFDRIIPIRRKIVWSNSTGENTPHGLFSTTSSRSKVSQSNVQLNFKSGKPEGTEIQFTLSEAPQWEFLPVKPNQYRNWRKSLLLEMQATPRLAQLDEQVRKLMVDPNPAYRESPFHLKILSGVVRIDTLNHIRSFLIQMMEESVFSHIFFINATNPKSIKKSFRHFSQTLIPPNSADSRKIKTMGTTAMTNFVVSRRSLMVFQNAEDLTEKALSKILKTTHLHLDRPDPQVKSCFCCCRKNSACERFTPTVLVLSGCDGNWREKNINSLHLPEYQETIQDVEEKTCWLDNDNDAKLIAQKFSACPTVLNLATATIQWGEKSQKWASRKMSKNEKKKKTGTKFQRMTSKPLKNYVSNFERLLADCAESPKLVCLIAHGPSGTWYEHLYVAYKLALDQLQGSHPQDWEEILLFLTLLCFAQNGLCPRNLDGDHKHILDLLRPFGLAKTDGDSIELKPHEQTILLEALREKLNSDNVSQEEGLDAGRKFRENLKDHLESCESSTPIIQLQELERKWVREFVKQPHPLIQLDILLKQIILIKFDRAYESLFGEKLPNFRGY